MMIKLILVTGILPDDVASENCPLTIVCADRAIQGNYNILAYFSRQVEELVGPLYR